MWSKPHGQTCPFNLGAGRDWVNTRPEQFSQAPGRMILFGGQGFAWSWLAHHKLVSSLVEQFAVCSSKRLRQTLKQPTCPKIKLCKASSSFPSLLLSLSFKVTAEGGLLTSHLESVTLFSPPWAVSQLCWESLEQLSWARQAVNLFVPLPLSLTLLIWPWSASFYKSLKSACFYKDCPFPGTMRPHLWQDPLLAVWHNRPTMMTMWYKQPTTYNEEVLEEAVLSLQSLSATQPPPEAPWQESFPQRGWKVEMKHTRFLEFSIPISRSFSQFLALDLQSSMRHIFILSMR